MVNECENITFKGLIFKYDIPTSLSGKIIEKSGGTLTIEISDGATISGNEYVTVVNSFNKNGIITKLALDKDKMPILSAYDIMKNEENKACN